jgi:hypothetical protein
MKKILIFTVLAIGVFAKCPSTQVICEDDESYSIVETEKRPSGRHNWMDMQHHYPDFINNRCGCKDEEFQRTEDRQVSFSE